MITDFDLCNFGIMRMHANSLYMTVSAGERQKFKGKFAATAVVAVVDGVERRVYERPSITKCGIRYTNIQKLQTVGNI